MRATWVSLLGMLPLVLMMALPARAGEVRVSAAASMAEAIRDIAVAFATEHPGVTVQTNFGASGALAKQIVAGGPADLFISADGKWIDYLVKGGKMAKGTVRTLASNALVVVGPKKTTITSLADLTRCDRIALGSPKSVPAGQYAEQAMTAAGVYGTLQTARKLVLAQDVRQALLYADRGEVDAAFVYRTDALLVKRAVILYQVPATMHERIAYPVGLTTTGAENPDAMAFSAYLEGPAAAAVLVKYGFATNPAPQP